MQWIASEVTENLSTQGPGVHFGAGPVLVLWRLLAQILEKGCVYPSTQRVPWLDTAPGHQVYAQMILKHVETILTELQSHLDFPLKYLDYHYNSTFEQLQAYTHTCTIIEHRSRGTYYTIIININTKRYHQVLPFGRTNYLHVCICTLAQIFLFRLLYCKFVAAGLHKFTIPKPRMVVKFTGVRLT